MSEKSFLTLQKAFQKYYGEKKILKLRLKVNVHTQTLFNQVSAIMKNLEVPVLWCIWHKGRLKLNEAFR